MRAESLTAHSFEPLTAPGITNFFALSPRVYSGSAPVGDAAFAALHQLGVRTIITVDGTQPDVEAAARHDLRYVHLPFGYDGVGATNLLQLVKAAETLPGPIFVHCHHGKHRGPTAAAILCEATEGWTPQKGLAWLKVAGTATNYPGLFRAVAEFHEPTEDELRIVSTNFPAHAQTPRLVDAMVQVDGHFDLLKAMAKAGFAPFAEHPDASPPDESMMILELFREARRQHLGAGRGATFSNALAAAEARANELHAALAKLGTTPSAAEQTAAQAGILAMGEQCAACHARWRDLPP